MYLVNASEMQQMDRLTIEAFGLPGRLLMENAGRGATRIFLKRFCADGKELEKRVAVVAGRGNNGGDGFVMARYLAQKEIPVTVFLLSKRDRLQGDAKANFDLLEPMAVPVFEVPDKPALEAALDRLRSHELFIDAILGTGLNSTVRGFYRRAILALNQMEGPVFAVDIPSGLDSDTGQVRGLAIHAAVTATFGFAKLGHCLHPGAQMSGRLEVIEIGIPPLIARQVGCRQRLITPDYLARRHRPRKADAHKGTLGHLLVLAGSTGKTGAAAMTSEAALRSGAGLVTLGNPQRLHAVLETRLLEVMTVPLPDDSLGQFTPKALPIALSLMEGKACLAIGPGVGTGSGTASLVQQVTAQCPLPMVIDADGLNNLIGHLDILEERATPTVITPHPGEMARLMSVSVATIQHDRIGAARSLAEKHGIIVVLKGAGTVIAHPDGKVFVNPTGNPGMAAGGMGDVLTGLIAGLITQGYEPGHAAHAGVFLHGMAADRLARKKGPTGYLASEVMEQIPVVSADLLCDRQPQFMGVDTLAYRLP